MSRLRLNPIGIQMIPQLIYKKLYGLNQFNNVNTDINLIVNKLKKSIENIQFKTDHSSSTINYPWESIAKYLPPLKNNDVVDHLNLLGRKYSIPYLNCINELVQIPDQLLENTPKKWNFESGWTRYSLNEDGSFSQTKVEYPLEKSIVFDIEVSLEESNNNKPTLAVALTPEAWYSWCGENLINANQTEMKYINFLDKLSIEDLIPMGRSDIERLIVGHNVSFDRSYIQEQYAIGLDKTRFLDTMSLHIAVSGLNQEQKMFAVRNGNPWDNVSSLNNLGDVYKLYCNPEVAVNKDPRNVFVKGTLLDVYENFHDLTDYCANDVSVTLKILKSLFPIYAKRFPSPITLAGMLEMSVMYLPVNRKTWLRYLNESQTIYHEFKEEINQTLKDIACETCNHMVDKKYLKDPWLWDLDWKTRPLAFKKSFTDKPFASKEDLVERLKSTAKHLKKSQQVLPGYPKWFVEFCDNCKYLHKLDRINFNETLDLNQLTITPKLRTIPKLLKLTWNGFPLHYNATHGWGYLVPDQFQELDSDSNVDLVKQIRLLANGNELDNLRREDGVTDIVEGCLFYKLPHRDGPSKRVGNPLSKDFISKIMDNTMRSSICDVENIVKQQNKISYWVNSSKRILSQMVVAYDHEQGSILPRVIVAGTVTRRAVEPTWLTASNSYSDRLGSELKGMIQCPSEYSYVGADVDSQELWIASLLGDATFSGIQGSTGLGWMTLQGDKSIGTDMHSVTANSINISRDEAKVLNYARIYGSGPNFAARFLRQSNPDLSEEEATLKAKKIFVQTKGVRRSFYDEASMLQVRKWANGTESHMFNKLEEIAKSEKPETPFLKCRISRALEPSAVGHDFMTSRINWVVQSSAVDFLHILLLSMKWLIEEYEIDGRFSISIHDEIRYIIRNEHKYRAALALQFSNLIARSFFTSMLNLNDLPASVAFFSSIEIDKCLRKNVGDDCKTPSNPLGLQKGYGIRPGESLTVQTLLEKLECDLEFMRLFKKLSAVATSA